MYCNKENINILTSLLVSHGIRHAVICPGSRNAAIAHNLNECPEITCYPVTDERSAGFYALGISLACNEPVVVCVTSGTALLNLSPAVAEATYRHHGLIVISADRPAAWIGQLDGQTLVQPDSFGVNTIKSVNLPEPHDEEERWFCNRLINEALLSVKTHSRKSVQINIPVSEPMFNFNVEKLPRERVIHILPSSSDSDLIYKTVINGLVNSARPMIVVGQMTVKSDCTASYLHDLSKYTVIISECLSSSYNECFEQTLMQLENQELYLPDFILYIGDTLISKRIKHFLRKVKSAECWQVSPDGDVHDVFMNLSGIIEGDSFNVLDIVHQTVLERSHEFKTDAYVALWQKEFCKVKNLICDYEPNYSQLSVVRELFFSLEDMEYNYSIHCANSMAVRIAQIYSSDFIWCNRGVNGIEGSISTAAGYSLVTSDVVFCITGDLSFFYDSNALWNRNIGGNLRIILLNNSGGGIFRGLKGLSASPAFEKIVSASHKLIAKGLCEGNDVGYLAARNMDELRISLAQFMTMETKRPLVLEVFTNQIEDCLVLEELNCRVKRHTK